MTIVARGKRRAVRLQPEDREEAEQTVAEVGEAGDELPPPFDLALYQTHPLNQDLAGLTAAEARHHYEAYGRPEGRPASAVTDRPSFLALVPKDGVVLEIGPGARPAFPEGKRVVRMLDAFAEAELQQQAGAAGQVPKIDVVWRGEPYHQLLKQQFDAVVALGSLDHQPCLISHLTYVSAVLKPGARYFVALPDRRYGEDHFLPDSGLPEVLDAFALRRIQHGARALVAPLFHGAHADAARHWEGDHGPAPQQRVAEEQHGRAVVDILRKTRAGSDYLDARAWQFTPDSFLWLMHRLAQYGLSPFRVERLYPTVKPRAEFYAVLRIAA